MPFKYESPLHRLVALSAVSETSSYNGLPCWDFLGTKTANGYGKIYERRRDGSVRTWLAHRWSAVKIGGKRARKGQVFKHLCNNRACVHPNHLLQGTQRSNVRQCVREGRHFTPFRGQV